MLCLKHVDERDSHRDSLQIVLPMCPLGRKDSLGFQHVPEVGTRSHDYSAFARSPGVLLQVRHGLHGLL